MTTFLDLSHRLEPGMPAYPGMPEPQFHTWFTHAESAERKLYAEGTTFQIARYDVPGNTGTYIDSPFHRHPDAPDFSGLPLEKVANLEGIVVHAAPDGPIGPEAFAGVEVAGKALIVRTDWSTRWGGDNYFMSGPYLTDEACAYLVQQGVALVGIDCANLDNMKDPERPAHTTLLAAGVPIVEHMTALDDLPSSGFRFFAVPPAIVGGTSFPVRAFAMWE
jgi:kynurenine formamidase